MNDTLIAEFCIDRAIRLGADKCRVNIGRGTSEIYRTLNGEIDSVALNSDNALIITIFADGRYANFSTNRLSKDALEEFIRSAVKMTKLLSADPAWNLPERSRCCRSAKTGDELELRDPSYELIGAQQKRQTALDAAVFGKGVEQAGYKIISEEGEYSDSYSETILADSEGLLCRHNETSFDYSSEVSIEDRSGRKYSAYSWDSSTRRAALSTEGIGDEALRKAVAMIGSSPAESGSYTMVADREVSGRLLTPVLSALNGSTLREHNSFLEGSLGKRIFTPSLTITDDSRIKGENGSRLFDTEGVEIPDNDAIIENGTVRKYFLSTYSAAKLGLSPTVSDYSRPHLLPFDGTVKSRDSLLSKCSDGILVTGLVGGNCNSATGDFSYGVEGFLFRGGRIERPVSGMLITGNMISLWKSLFASADDCRRCQGKLVPSIAFENVSFNG